jgi:hypothetical protein
MSAQKINILAREGELTKHGVRCEIYDLPDNTNVRVGEMGSDLNSEDLREHAI